MSFLLGLGIGVVAGPLLIKGGTWLWEKIKAKVDPPV